MNDYLQDAAILFEFFERTNASRRSQVIAVAAALATAHNGGILPADARALYAALRNIAWPTNEIEAASAKLKAIGESDGVAVWNPRRSRNDGPELGWVRK